MDPSDGGVASWVEQELAGSTFKDKRLDRRLRKLLVQMAGAVGAPLPLACQDWANTKAAYRFLSNETVSEAEILAGHFRSTHARVAAADGPILVLQDTTEFSYQRARPERIGVITTAPSRRGANGKLKMHTVCGLLMHASLAVTTQGLPLGLAAVKFWTRAKFKGTNALKRKINPTRVPIEGKESIRWLENMRQATALLGDPARLIHVGDRENDIDEFFCAAQAAGTHFLVRACVDRLAGDGQHTIASEMAEVAVQGLHRVEVTGDDGKTSQACVELRYRRIHVRPPIGKQKRYPALDLTVIHAQERGKPEGRAGIDWKLITDLPVHSPEDAIEKLGWYARRWTIELFHKILKSGCRAEEARLRTAERLVNLLALFCILSWRLFWLTMINRAAPEASPRLALTKGEIRLLDRMAGRPSSRSPPATLSDYLVQIARLGGYLARASDPPPGPTVMWRGWSRLMDIKLGAALVKATYG
jgi:Transposase DNA-binding